MRGPKTQTKIEPSWILVIPQRTLSLKDNTGKIRMTNNNLILFKYKRVSEGMGTKVRRLLIIIINTFIQSTTVLLRKLIMWWKHFSYSIHANVQNHSSNTFVSNNKNFKLKFNKIIALIKQLISYITKPEKNQYTPLKGLL